jgi:RNA polymerase sigma-70 factor, ECF subfamily
LVLFSRFLAGSGNNPGLSRLIGKGVEMTAERVAMDIAQLVAEYHQAVYRYAYRLTGSVPDAEDLTQQTFLAAQQKLDQVRNPECARNWLFTVLRNLFFKDVQRRQPLSAVDLQLNIDNIPKEIPGDETIDREQVQQALDELHPTYRVVLVMFYYEDCSYREIAEQLDLPIGTVMSRLARAKGYLRAKLFGPDGGEPAETSAGIARQRR